MIRGIVFEKQMSGGRDVSGTVGGSISTHNATINISPVSVSSFAGVSVHRGAQLGYLMMGLHETIHHAGKNGYYSDAALAAAAFNLMTPERQALLHCRIQMTYSRAAGFGMMNLKGIVTRRGGKNMMTIKAFLLCSCITTFMIGLAQNVGWRGIVPLHSTREDVERLLGPSAKPDGYSEVYDLGKEAVFIKYSSGPCRKERKGGYNVPSGTVKQIRVSSSAKPQFSDLQIDENKYEKTVDPELPGVFHYVNREEGIAYEVQTAR